MAQFDLGMAQPDELTALGMDALQTGKVKPGEVRTAMQMLKGKNASPMSTDWLQNQLAPKQTYVLDLPNAGNLVADKKSGLKQDAKLNKEAKSQTTRNLNYSPEEFLNLTGTVGDLPGIAEQREGIQNMEELLAMQMAHEAPSQDHWIRPLTSLADAWSGSNLTKNLPAADTQAMKNARNLNALDELQKRKSELNKSIFEGVTKMKSGTQSDSVNNSLMQQLSYLTGALAQKGASKDGGRELTPFEKKRDTQFATRYGEFLDEGGFAGQEQDLEAMQGIVKDLEESGDNEFTGPVVGLTPTALRKIKFPKSWAQQQNYEAIIQKSLKRILGGQFAEKEARELFKRSYDPMLPQAENAARIKRAFNEISKSYKAFADAAAYVEGPGNGSLQGYRGSRNITINGRKYDIDPTQGSGGTTPSGGGGAGAPTGGGMTAEQKKRLEELRAKRGG